MPYCPRCGTGLSSHEVAQGYKDVKDATAFVKFKVRRRKQVYTSLDNNSLDTTIKRCSSCK